MSLEQDVYLGEIFYLHDSVILPQLQFLGKLEFSVQTRQVVGEIRNAHTHIYRIAQEEREKERELKKARNHLHRGALDCYKIVYDSLQSSLLVSGSRKSLAFIDEAAVLMEERYTHPPYADFDKKVSVEENITNYHKQFESWIKAIGKLCDGIIKIFPRHEGILTCLIDNLSQPNIKNITFDNDSLSELIHFEKLISLETRYRILTASRVTEHYDFHLILFKSLLDIIRGTKEKANQQYKDLIDQRVGMVKEAIEDHYEKIIPGILEIYRFAKPKEAEELKVEYSNSEGCSEDFYKKLQRIEIEETTKPFDAIGGDTLDRENCLQAVRFQGLNSETDRDRLFEALQILNTKSTKGNVS
jgi:hypothetical protein